MSHTTGKRTDQLESALPDLRLPKTSELTSEELERRREQLVRAHEIRTAIMAKCGPLGITAGELKHLAREEAED